MLDNKLDYNIKFIFFKLSLIIKYSSQRPTKEAFEIRLEKKKY